MVLKPWKGRDDTNGMSDLSNLLGDLYGEHGSPDGPSVRHEPPAGERAPEWASDSRLDQAFEDWTPEAHGSGTTPIATDDDLTAALSAALGSAPVAPPPPAPAPAPAPVMPAAAPPAPAPVAEAPRAPWTAAAALAEATPEPVHAPAPAPVVPAPVSGGPRLWTRGDDDIFPGRKR
jgi:hypothetical protein